MSRGAVPGFTLLELLVALVVLGFILAGIAQGMQFGTRVASQQGRVVAEHADVAPAEAMLRRLVADADPGTQGEPTEFAGGGGSLAFTTGLGVAALGVSGEAAVALGVDADRRLVLRWSPATHAVRLGPVAPPGSAVLLDGVQGVEFAYWGRSAGGGDQWQASWGEKTLPALVRIRLRFVPELRRAWPDIIAATARRRAGE